MHSMQMTKDRERMELSHRIPRTTKQQRIDTKSNNGSANKHACQQQQSNVRPSQEQNAKTPPPPKLPALQPPEGAPAAQTRSIENSPAAALAALAFSFFFLAALALVLRPMVAVGCGSFWLVALVWRSGDTGRPSKRRLACGQNTTY